MIVARKRGRYLNMVAADVQRVLDTEIRPLLQFHGGDIRLADVTLDGVVDLEYWGACRGCFMQPATHYITVRQRLLRVGGVKEVVCRDVRLSEAAAQRIAEAYDYGLSSKGRPERT